MKRALIYSLLALFVQSCQTGQEIPPEEKLPDMNHREALSPDLWSPEQRKSNANYYFYLAEDRLLAQDKVTALKLYELSYSLDPNSFVAAKLISLKAYQNPEEAFAQARKMVLLYPKDPDLNVLLGQFYLAKGRLKSAEKQFNRVLALDNSSSEAYLGLIQTYRSMNKTQKAIMIAKEMMASESGFADGWALLAKMYLSEKNLKEAHKAAKRAHDLRSNNLEYVHLYAITLELLGKSKKAVRLYEIIFRNHPDNDELIARMVNLYKQIGSLDDALELLKEVLRKSRTNSFPLKLQLVFIQWELKKYKEAHKLLKEMLEEFPNNDRIAYMSAMGSEKMEQWPRAIRLYRGIKKESQFYIHGRFRLMLVYRQLKQYDNAIEIGKEIVSEKNERAPDFYMLMANIESDRKSYSSAVSILEKGVKSFPERTDLLFLLGVNQERDGNIKDCIETMRFLIKVDPEHSGAYNYLGYIFAERSENLGEAEKLIKMALKLKPNDGYYMDSLGWVYYKKKDYKKALEFLVQADSLAPNEGVILEHIGDVYKALNKNSEAEKYYKKALSSRIEKEDKVRVEKKYNEIKSNNT